MATTSSATPFPRFNFTPSSSAMPTFSFGQTTEANAGTNHSANIFSNQTIAQANPNTVLELTEPALVDGNIGDDSRNVGDENRNDGTVE